ncbi:MAG: hypothetical protein IPK13_06835 [Deltaproteobacteria bacterium]|nr:hypothetical protein [Deltaproteobacteria bacterium]
MRIAYGVHGYSRGHATRALDLISSQAYPLHQEIDLERAQAFVRKEHQRMSQTFGLQRRRRSAEAAIRRGLGKSRGARRAGMGRCLP